jgi:hypothetical protein
MNQKQLDDLIQKLLDGLKYCSRFGTCLGIRVADYSAQICGYRSTRQVDDNNIDDVHEQFENLMMDLDPHIQECLMCIKLPHTYKQAILEMNELEVECTLETALYEMIIFDCSLIFSEYFFEVTDN